MSQAAETFRKMKTSRFNFWALLDNDRWVLLNGVTGAMYELCGDEWTEARSLLDRPGAFVLNARPSPIVEALVNGGMVLPESVDEVGSLLAPPGERRQRVLELTVVPTWECNFRCTYCYIEFKSGRMGASVQERIARLVEWGAKESSRIDLSWFGGEPLLELGTVVDLSRRVGRIAEHCGVPWIGLLATNGLLLTPERARQLVASGVDHFHVTIDGPARHHDRMRVLPHGGPTFDRAFANLRNVLEKVPQANVTLRMNTRDGTVDDCVEVLAAIPRQHRHRVQFHATDVRGEGCSPSQQFFGRIAAVTGAALKLGYAYYDNMISAARTEFCHADRPWHFQIGPDGALYRCSPSAEKPEVHVGRLGEDGIPQFNNQEARWRAIPSVLDECRECRFLCFCRGGCRLRRLHRERDPSCQDRYQHIEQLVVNRYLARTASMTWQWKQGTSS